MPTMTDTPELTRLRAELADAESWRDEHTDRLEDADRDAQSLRIAALRDAVRAAEMKNDPDYRDLIHRARNGQLDSAVAEQLFVEDAEGLAERYDLPVSTVYDEVAAESWRRPRR